MLSPAAYFCRYGKVVLLTDADVDGAHIRTLLLTFLFRYRKELFQQGRVYVAVPPLYRIETSRSGKPRWAYSEEGKAAVLQGLTAKEGASAVVTRFKGLGEMMPEQLWQTTMNPETRWVGVLGLQPYWGWPKTYFS